MAKVVYEPSNLEGCQLALAIVSEGKSSLDLGRCAQNMILAAWNEAIGSCPNGTHDADAANAILGLSAESRITTILSIGYPLLPHTPNPDDIDGILRRIKRKPLEELVVYL
jgi:nitroreductase